MSAFKQRYQNDPEFKKRHLDHIKEIITCECGHSVKRGYISKHRKLQKHIKEMGIKEKEKEIENYKLIEKLKEEIKELKSMKEKLNNLIN